MNNASKVSKAEREVILTRFFLITSKHQIFLQLTHLVVAYSYVLTVRPVLHLYSCNSFDIIERLGHFLSFSYSLINTNDIKRPHFFCGVHGL